MKTHVEVSSSRRKCRKAHFSAPSHIKYTLMSAHLSKDLRSKHSIRSLPVRKEDEVIIVRGNYKGNKGKITSVYRKKNCVYVEKVSKTKANGAPYQIPLHPSALVITKLKLDRCRSELIKRKADGLGKGKKDKYEGQMD
ncbi:Translation protein SH3-like domain [Pseudocohnilembus persalinus]|uniref:Translation protein SH3-like domain n=1 Tax=Pseudocohnilembus persalinus TaxID=266149 RepID=A0A0V0R887_PSEPJ|nr:Translation protein SH3-like domain [Pseudocohnilembus persalinus]|eukprot:KRX10691.1 Translation protein SH3-like domain [Pseudocohnilembus persalinus]